MTTNTKVLAEAIHWPAPRPFPFTKLGLGEFNPGPMGPWDALNRAITANIYQPKLTKLKRYIGYGLTSASPDGDFHVRIKNDISVYISGLQVCQTSKSGDKIPDDKFKKIVRAYQYYLGCACPADITTAVEMYLLSKHSVKLGTRGYLVHDSEAIKKIKQLHELGVSRFCRLEVYDSTQNKEQTITEVVDALLAEAVKIASDLKGKTSSRADASRGKRADELEQKLVEFESVFATRLDDVRSAISNVRDATTAGLVMGTIQDSYQDELDAIFSGDVEFDL